MPQYFPLSTNIPTEIRPREARVKATEIYSKGKLNSPNTLLSHTPPAVRQVSSSRMRQEVAKPTGATRQEIPVRFSPSRHYLLGADNQSEVPNTLKEVDAESHVDAFRVSLA